MKGKTKHNEKDILRNHRCVENTEETRSSGNYPVFHKGEK